MISLAFDAFSIFVAKKVNNTNSFKMSVLANLNREYHKDAYNPKPLFKTIRMSLFMFTYSTYMLLKTLFDTFIYTWFTKQFMKALHTILWNKMPSDTELSLKNVIVCSCVSTCIPISSHKRNISLRVVVKIKVLNLYLFFSSYLTTQTLDNHIYDANIIIYNTYNEAIIIRKRLCLS